MKKKIGIKGIDIRGLETKDVIFKIEIESNGGPCEDTSPKFLAMESLDSNTFTLKGITAGGNNEGLDALEAKINSLQKTIQGMSKTISTLEAKVETLVSASTEKTKTPK